MTARERVARDWHEGSDHAKDGTPFGGPLCNCDRIAGRILPMLRDAWAVTRDDIDRALINVTSNASNYPDPQQMLGKDTGPLRSKCVDAICDLLGIETEHATEPREEA